ncbi:hypothetical protein ACN42_g10905 [Penicillium freii]|uniref:Uncharacterized protein n=1 Tax=Penicillium freii TaxID=48697 RepID=A0A101M957_PENFR|nr:hypothetical protein ACN42_g10905 [Penicillium freii]
MALIKNCNRNRLYSDLIRYPKSCTSKVCLSRLYIKLSYSPPSTAVYIGNCKRRTKLKMSSEKSTPFEDATKLFFYEIMGEP